MDFIFTFFRVILRLSVFFFLMAVYLSRGYWIHHFVKDPLERKKRFSRLANWTAKIICKYYQIRVTTVNPPPPDSPGLVIGNHLGFIDILASCSTRPMLFVTSIEMRQTPLLGLLTEMGGCIYVERRSRLGIQKELEQMVESLKEGFNVCLYPEATSHNGEHVLPFKRTLITSAAHAGVPVHPYVFNFHSVEGDDFSLENRDSVCWYGDIPFTTAFFKALTIKYVDVEVKFLDPQHTTIEMDRAEVAHKLHQMISEHFKPVK